jgi:hypothetical protein
MPQVTIGQPSGSPFQNFCSMVGLLTLTWAWAETSLAIAIGVINEQAGPIKGHPEAPLSLSRRIAYFKAALREIVQLKPLREEGNALD